MPRLRLDTGGLLLTLFVGSIAPASALAPRPTRRTFVTCGAAAAAASSLAPPVSATLSRDGYPVQRSYPEWQKALSEQQFFVLREGGTEPPFSSPFLREKGPGTFRCAACDIALFDARQKFDSGTGWPSFAKALPAVQVIDGVGGVAQTAVLGAEARCGECGGHLGDLFLDGFLFPGKSAFLTGKRYCIDGVSARTQHPTLLSHPPKWRLSFRPSTPLMVLCCVLCVLPAAQAALVFEPAGDPEERVYGEGCVVGKKCIVSKGVTTWRDAGAESSS